VASILKIGSRWRALVRRKGYKPQCRTFDTRREAEAWAGVRLAELRDASSRPAGERYTLSDALGKYLAEITPAKRGTRNEQIRLAKMMQSMPALPVGKLIGEVTTADLAVWRDARMQAVSSGTVLREIGLLSAVLETARRDWQWIASNPIASMRKPRQPDHRDIVISPRQIRAMLRALAWRSGPCKSTRQAAGRAFVLALRTGMRAGEICKLEWSRVHADYCELPVTKTKPRNVPLTPRSRALIESMRGWDDRLVFGVSAQTLDATFRRARDAAGLAGFTFHDSRHTAATRLARKLDVLDLCKMFGWASTTQALTYYNPTASEIAGRLR
jgi:integrase